MPLLRQIVVLFLLSFIVTSTSAATRSDSSRWAGVEKLISEQKFQAALEQSKEILTQAKLNKDQRLWTESLIKATQLQIGLHGYETAVRFLMDEPWPQDTNSRILLNLYFGQSLLHYEEAYGWEIGKREKTVNSLEKVDLKAWTTVQIGEKVSQTFDAIMAFEAAQNEIMNEPIPEFFKAYLTQNNYPPGIRGTLRDLVVYSATAHLANTVFWTPVEANEVYKLNLLQLATTPPTVRLKATSETAHPLMKIASWLGEHREFHLHHSRHEAAREAQYELIQRFHAAAKEDADKSKLAGRLRNLQRTSQDLAWWSHGQALLAEFDQQGTVGGRLITAHRDAEAGHKAHPDSIGGKQCRAILATLEAPDYQIQAMASDNTPRASFALEYKNLKTLYFRAFPINIEDQLKNPLTNEFFGFNYRWRDQLKHSTPVAEWSTPLAQTPDYAHHRHLITPSGLKPGAYAILASARADFQTTNNELKALSFIVSDVVLVSEPNKTGDFEFRVLSGESGLPLKGTDVQLYRFQWLKPPELVTTKTTAESGVVSFNQPTPSVVPGTYWNYFFLAKKGPHWAMQRSVYWTQPTSADVSVNSAFIYTDRSIYRPQQKIQWKVIGYSGTPKTGKFTTAAAGTVIDIELYDPNNQVVAKQRATLNAFGSGSGEFQIPSGRPLGGWRIGAPGKAYSDAQIQVEEYQRPTFAASLNDATTPLRLNRKAHLQGEARYYFGLPVTNGSVRWRVLREEVLPWWFEFGGWNWHWLNRPQIGQANALTVASGTATMQPDGKFNLDFTPEADEREAKAPGVTFNFSVSVDVTDEGGETRSSTKTYRLGFVSLEANLTMDSGFFTVNQAASVDLAVTSLDGKSKVTAGTYRIVQLAQAEKTPLPADLPRTMNQGQQSDSAADLEHFATSGDRHRARWETGYRWETVTADWKEKIEIKKEKIKQNQNGHAEIKIPALNSAGVYRLIYETKDDFGTPYRLSRDFIVADNRSAIALPITFIAEKSTVQVGEKARLFLHSGLKNQMLRLETFRSGERQSEKILNSSKDAEIIEVPISMSDRGGFTWVVTLIRDHQLMREEISINVPWKDRELKVEFATFRDKLRPGTKEIFRLKVKNDKGQALPAGTVELLAYMYDRSLDLFTPHTYPTPLSVYASRTGALSEFCSLMSISAQGLDGTFTPPPPYPFLISDRLKFFENYGIGGPGARGGRGRFSLQKGGDGMAYPAAAAFHGAALKSASASAPVAEPQSVKKSEARAMAANASLAAPDAPAAAPLRTNFSETAFFSPHLVNDEKDEVAVEFTVPDSVTSWNVFAHAISKDLRSGTAHRETKSVKELMVRPYAPRFLREGDQADIKVSVNNASDQELAGEIFFDLQNPETGQSVATLFGLSASQLKKTFSTAKGASMTVSFHITAPSQVGTYAFKVLAKSKTFSDGELRPFPVLPSRVHLAQSRFVTLRNKEQKTMEFKELAANQDLTRINEKMVVTVDAQLFYSVLQSLPYLIKYPYECVEQTLNRFLSTGIVTSVFQKYPAVAKMAQEFSSRKTQLESFDNADPNRRMSLEETPWLQEAQGGHQGDDMINVLNAKIAKAERDRALARLQKMQLPNGAFPWFEGGPEDHYITLYLLMGFARALEFKVDVPKELVTKAWQSTREWLDRDLKTMMDHDCCAELVTLTAYALSSYPDSSWTGGFFDEAYRQTLLDYSFKHWKEHSPLLKGYLALTLQRKGRAADAKLVWDAVMDSAKYSEELGTYWAQEDRSWLWYNDTTETHAFSLRTLMELDPTNKNNEGLVQWLFLNKKLNHWKSTRATAEVIYSLVHYLEKTAALGERESVSVTWNQKKTDFNFEPDVYTGKKNQIALPGDKITPQAAKIIVEKSTPGFAFASATWQFSTDRLPKEEQGDFLSVSRHYFKREFNGKTWTLTPLQEGSAVKIGEQIEVQLSLRTKHEAEYVHLRDPRAAGLEPESLTSGYKWEFGLSWLEEIRDSGSNFFFSKLPVGEYTFKYRLRANMAGQFRIGPATVESMYAPEFNAYSAGSVMTIR